jgi:enoyl-CoA hydratase/carnithine racemase
MTTHLNVRPDGVAVIQLDNPPVNSLASTLVVSFKAHLEQCIKDSNVKGIVVTGKGNLFCGGAAVDEMGKKGGDDNAGAKMVRRDRSVYVSTVVGSSESIIYFQCQCYNLY